MNWGHLLFGFSGRISRAKYWLAILVFAVVSMIDKVMAFALDQTIGHGNYGVTLVLSIVSIVIIIGSLISSIAVVIKRLHDRNKSGWWLMVFYGVPLALIAVAAAIMFAVNTAGSDGPALAYGVAVVLCLGAVALWIWALVELGGLEGTHGPNLYGPDPLEG